MQGNNAQHITVPLYLSYREAPPWTIGMTYTAVFVFLPGRCSYLASLCVNGFSGIHFWSDFQKSMCCTLFPSGKSNYLLNCTFTHMTRHALNLSVIVPSACPFAHHNVFIINNRIAHWIMDMTQIPTSCYDLAVIPLQGQVIHHRHLA